MPHTNSPQSPAAGHMVAIEQRDAVNAAIHRFWEQIVIDTFHSNH